MQEVVPATLPHPQVVHPLLEVVDGLLLLLEAGQLGGDGGALGDDDPHQLLDGVTTLGSLVQESSDTRINVRHKVRCYRQRVLPSDDDDRLHYLYLCVPQISTHLGCTVSSFLTILLRLRLTSLLGVSPIPASVTPEAAVPGCCCCCWAPEAADLLTTSLTSDLSSPQACHTRSTLEPWPSGLSIFLHFSTRQKWSGLEPGTAPSSDLEPIY